MWLFYFFAAIVIWLGIISLRGGFRYSSYVKSQLTNSFPKFTPFASVIVPCRGLEENLSDNLAALFLQRYPAYEIIFVADSASDAALGVINKLIQSETSRQVPARVLVAGAAEDSGQKVHNLRVAAGAVDPRCEVLVLVDSDAHPQTSWLCSLVAPLQDEALGATTGYRWFVPTQGGLASHLRSVWNASIASALGAKREGNFCWGGSTAIRRGTFDRLDIIERWRGSVSDDFTLTRVLGEAKLPIHFVPACLVASRGDCDFGELLEFTNRQLKITRVYAPHLWKPVLIGSLLFCLVFFGGVGLVIARGVLGLPFAVPLALVAVIFLLGAGKAFLRFRVVTAVLRSGGVTGSGSLIAHLLLWPFASALYLVNALNAAFSRRIRWRGITYELKSPTEVGIIKGASSQ
jgi:cellulose synthase/poly-beta-1,6-N-acetylglucosamine synthase-like glycosyltransferase